MSKKDTVEVQLEPVKDEANNGTTFSEISSEGGTLSPLDEYKNATDKKLADIETLTKAILAIAVISLVGLIITVAGLVIDQMRFNNQTYKENTYIRVRGNP